MKVYKATYNHHSTTLSMPNWLKTKYVPGVEQKPVHPYLPFWAYLNADTAFNDYSGFNFEIWECEAKLTSLDVWMVPVEVLKGLSSPVEIETIWRLKRDIPYSFDFIINRCNPDIVFCSEITLLKEIIR